MNRLEGNLVPEAIISQAAKIQMFGLLLATSKYSEGNLFSSFAHFGQAAEGLRMDSEYVDLGIKQLEKDGYIRLDNEQEEYVFEEPMIEALYKTFIPPRQRPDGGDSL